MHTKETTQTRHIVMIMVILCASIGFLHTTKKYKPNSLLAGKEVIEDINTLSPSQFYTYVETLLHTHNISILSQIIMNVPIKKAEQFLQIICSMPQSPLDDYEKTELLFSVVSHKKDKNEQLVLLNILSHIPQTDTPLLIVAIQKGFDSLISVILEWSHSSTGHAESMQHNSIYNAFLYTIVHNDTHLFELLLRNNVPIYTDVAYKLLSYVKESNKSQFMALFVQAQALLPYDTYQWLIDLNAPQTNVAFNSLNSFLFLNG